MTDHCRNMLRLFCVGGGSWLALLLAACARDGLSTSPSPSSSTAESRTKERLHWKPIPNALWTPSDPVSLEREVDSPWMQFRILSLQHESGQLPHVRIRTGGERFGIRFRFRVRRLLYAATVAIGIYFDAEEDGFASWQRKCLGLGLGVGGGGGSDGQAQLDRNLGIALPGGQQRSQCNQVSESSRYTRFSYWNWTAYEAEVHWLPKEAAAGEKRWIGTVRVRVRLPRASERYGQSLTDTGGDWVYDRSSPYLPKRLGASGILSVFHILTTGFIGDRGPLFFDCQGFESYGDIDCVPSEHKADANAQVRSSVLYGEARAAERKKDFATAAARMLEAYRVAQNALRALEEAPKQKLSYEMERCSFHSIWMTKSLLPFFSQFAKDHDGDDRGHWLLESFARDRIAREALIAKYTTAALDPTADGVPDVATAYARSLKELEKELDWDLRWQYFPRFYLGYLRRCEQLRLAERAGKGIAEDRPRSVKDAQAALRRDPWDYASLRFLTEKGGKAVTEKQRRRWRELRRCAGLH